MSRVWLPQECVGETGSKEKFILLYGRGEHSGSVVGLTVGYGDGPYFFTTRRLRDPSLVLWMVMGLPDGFVVGHGTS